MKELIKHKLGNLTALYAVKDGIASLAVVPASTVKYVDEKKLFLEGVKWSRLDPLVQVHVAGDAVNRQYSAGRTMRNSESGFALKYAGQAVKKKNGAAEIVTKFTRDDGQTAEHRLIYKKGRRFLESRTVYTNESGKEITLEMLSSFSLGGLTPYTLDNSAGKIELHRLRSQWSAEAEPDSFPAEAIQCEPSWMNYGARGERFGAVGSTPCRGFMPLIGLTDRARGVTWAVSLACASSWQMEYYLAQNSVNLSGGLADFEFGHWRKVLKSGESLTAPTAYLTAVRGDFDEAAQILTEVQREKPLLPSEESLPILFNEYCKTWNKPTREALLPLIDTAADLGVGTFVIDAGWFDESDGLYTPKKAFYPNGIAEVVRYIKHKGMRAGIWFEFESLDYDGQYRRGGIGDDLLLQRDGHVIRNLERSFIDLRKSETEKLLTERVIGFLRENGFDYLKVDYNENIGVGCDGAESLGEGLRQQVAAVQDFFRKIKRELPELCIEMCASGGMRTEPSMIALADQVSYSDLHETDDGAIVAGNMHRVLQPARSQVWAVSRPSDDENRWVNTLSKCFLGRMCLSGDLDLMNDIQRRTVERAIALYRNCADVIRDGFSFYLSKRNRSLRQPDGFTAVLRAGAAGAVLVVNTFGEPRGALTLRHKALKGLNVQGIFAAAGVRAGLKDGVLEITGMGARSGCVIRFSE
ncbi:hypothetical protein FACS1894211_06110 [Clostridia bacterium]|nr:hypothetical protein FACS1894211_06110 [Clostridia bacterium]